MWLEMEFPSFSASTEGTEQKDRFNGLQLAIHLDEIDVAKRDLQTKNADVCDFLFHITV